MYRRRITSRLKQRLYGYCLVAFLVFVLVASVVAPAAQAKTYHITDGDRTITYTTFASDPAEILDRAGMDLRESDAYVTEPTGNGETITVHRSQNVTVYYHGEPTTVTTFGETAGELLQRLKISVTGEDVVSHPMEAETYDGMELRVDRVVTVPQTYTAAIPHETYRCNDPTVPVGLEDMLTAGVDGEMLCTADVTYINGEEAGRKVRSERVIRAPVTEIIGVGTGQTAAAADPYGMPEIGDRYIKLPTGEVLTYTDTATIRATAYTHTDAGCDFTTSTGTKVHRGTVAVDPRYIPYGTKMFIVASDGSYVYGLATAEDCGGDIKGDRMDLYLPTHEQCIQFGRRVCTLYFLG